MAIASDRGSADPLTEQRTADPHMRGPEARGELIISAHSHRDERQVARPRETGKQREMRASRLVRWRDAHQSADIEPALARGNVEQRVKLVHRHTGLLRLVSGIDLNEAGHLPADLVHRLAQLTRELWPVQRLDHVEKRDRIFRLVGLQRSDKVKFQSRDAGAPVGPVRMCLLNAVFAEHKLARGNCGLYPVAGLAFGNGHKRDVMRAGALQRLEDLVPARGNIVIDHIGHVMKLNSAMGIPRKLRLGARRASTHLPAGLPPVLAFTDPWRGAAPLDLAACLPAGWGLVYRHFGAPDRNATANRLAWLARRRGLILLIGADPVLAARVGADGVHWPQARAGEARHWAGRFRLMTASAHHASDLLGPQPRAIDARVLSTVFPSDSPSAGQAMGAIRFRMICHRSDMPVYALGGVTAESAQRVAKHSGLAAVVKTG